MKSCMVATVIIVSMSAPNVCHAQWSKALREGVKLIFKNSDTVAREGAEQGAKKLGGKAASSVLKEGAESTTLQTFKVGVSLPSTTGMTPLSALLKHGKEITTPVIKQLGDEGATALARLSTPRATQLAVLAPDLARSPHRSAWLKVIVDKGDSAVEWLWRRKGSIAVGTGAAAAALAPEQFLMAAEGIVSTGIKVTGENVVQPVVKGAIGTVTTPTAPGSWITVVPIAMWNLFCMIIFVLIARAVWQKWLRLYGPNSP